MMEVQKTPYAAVEEAIRPKSSGRFVDAHVVRTQKEPSPDYEKMRRIIAGESIPEPVKKAS
jgi:hypothetical protein